MNADLNDNATIVPPPKDWFILTVGVVTFLLLILKH